jgi:hypothetical protein
MHKTTSTSKRIRNLSIEVAIAIVLVGSLVVFRFRHPETDLNWSKVALFGNTAIVFGYLVAWFRDVWRRPIFWAYVSAALIVHLAGYLVILNRIPQFPFVYYVLLNAGEIALLVLFLRKQISNGS